MDALERDAVVNAVRGSGQFVVTIGFPYSGIIWRDAWPKAMSNFVAACKATGERMVFIENLYMYGARCSRRSREIKEMRFQWDRPYQVDASRFKAAFWSDVTPFDIGVGETARAFHDQFRRSEG